jgi:biotin carboxyl carrier protein
MNEYQFKINGNDYKVNILKINEEEASVEVNGTQYSVNIEQLFMQKTPKLVRAQVVQESYSRERLTEDPARDISFNLLKAPLPGLIMSVNVKVGDTVQAGQVVIKMEAMKMENEIHAQMVGTVKEIFVSKGENVLEGAPLLKIG